MIIIPGIISEADAKHTVSIISALPWVPGENPNAEYREKIKQNEELKAEHNETAKTVVQGLQDAILKHNVVRTTLFPYKMVLPSLNRYSGGGSYNRHADHALQGTPHLRSDISMTLFLSDPADYYGGELYIFLGAILGMLVIAVINITTAVHLLVGGVRRRLRQQRRGVF